MEVNSDTEREGPLSSKSKSPPKVDEPRFAQCASNLRLEHREHMQKNHTMDFLPMNIQANDRCSTASLLSLQRVSISDLRPNKTHKGRYLILRTLEMPFENTCLNTIVEDDKGTGALLSLYNMDVKPHEDMGDSWPLGTIFFLKEPSCLEIKDGVCYLQCFNPSDLIFVYDRPDLLELTRQIHWVSDTEDPMYTQPLPSSPRDWFDLGMKFLRNDKIELSMRCCHIALHEADRMHVEDLNLHSNICSMLVLAYYLKGIYEKAITFAERVTNLGITKRVYVSAAESYYKLRKYEDAHERFQFCQNFYPDDALLNESTQKTELRLVEMLNGDFSMYGMFQAKRMQAPFQCADYIGPIRKQAIEGKGRGVVATRQLEPGTLLVVSKALAFSRNSRNAKTKSWEELVAQLSLLIKQNPTTFGRVIYSLFDGSNPVDESSVKVFCSPEAEQEPILDMKKLKGIVMINAIGDTSDIHMHRSTLKSNPLQFGCGVYDMPSYFNHSCLPNASLHEFNDVVVIRAIKTINDGEEVCIQYVSWEVPYIVRKRFLAIHGFECNCKFCQLESKATTSDLNARHKVAVKREEMYNLITYDDDVYVDTMLDNVNDMLFDLYTTYQDPTDLSLKVLKSAMYSLSAKVYSMSSCDHPRKREEEIEDHLITLSCLGLNSKKLIFSLVNDGESLLPNDAILDENVLFACSRLVFLYNDLLKINNAKSWFRILVAFENIYSGGDVQVLKQKYNYLRHLFDTLMD